MPIPQRENNEPKEKFISRCMSDEVMDKEYPDRSQRYAICNSQAEKKSFAQRLIDELVKRLKNK